MTNIITSDLIEMEIDDLKCAFEDLYDNMDTQNNQDDYERVADILRSLSCIARQLRVDI